MLNSVHVACNFYSGLLCLVEVLNHGHGFHLNNDSHSHDYPLVIVLKIFVTPTDLSTFSYELDSYAFIHST